MTATSVIFFLLFIVNVSQGQTYIAAIAEHSPFSAGDNGITDPLQVMQKNIAKYEIQLNNARNQKAQIIVFPEFGLTSSVFDSRETAEPYTELIPDFSNETVINPCMQSIKYANSPVFLWGSCAARNYSIVLVLNMLEILPCSSTDSNCPSDGHFQFNVDVVFDEKGQFIAKYRKTHIWYPQAIDAPPNPQLVTFTTSFGITFGMMICYDIAFDFPGRELVDRGVKHFPYSVAQSIIGPEIISTWSYFESATVLSANLGMYCGVYVSGYDAKQFSIAIDSDDATLIATVPF